MKIVVTHASPDWDAITSVWLIKRFFPGWDGALVKFVPAGERYKNQEVIKAIEMVGNDEVIHVDTGMGPLDHHQTSDRNVSAASLAFAFVKQSEISKEKIEALERIVRIVVDIDHFLEVFWDNPISDRYEFSLLGILDGLKLFKPNQDDYYVEFGMTCLDALVHNFENRIWAEKEIEEHGVPFKTKWGKGIGFETINDTVLDLSQKMGYVVVLRKDPRKGYVRIKARPHEDNKPETNLTLVYEKLKKIDPEATWYLHVSNKMLLNGSVKNPKMKPTKLSLTQLISVLESV